MNALQHLDFIVKLTDMASGPAGKIMKSMDTMTTKVQDGYKKIGYGAAGIWGAGAALDNLLTPAKEMNRALGEVKSLGVADKTLKQLTSTSLKFSMQYGESAADFVRSSYDIQSAISGLVGDELTTFTNASNILAKGTKSDAATITDYVGTMYGIFKNGADQMGRGQWVEMLAGQTAAAVQIFKTTGTEMSAAFGNLGAEATSHGIAMNEQMAILGQLQSTMSGSESATKYRAFLSGVGKAQEALGLQFTDSQGRMLPMVDILNAIKGKFGEIDTVAESDMLQKAFGTKEAVSLIKLLSSDVGGLSNNIQELGKQTGLEKAIQMAKDMSDPFKIASASVDALKTVLGRGIIPWLLPVFNLFGDIALRMLRWSNLFPNLTKWVGFLTLLVFGVIASISALSIIVGINKFMLVGWGIAGKGLKLIFTALRWSIMKLIPSIFSFSAALLTSPITWMVVIITGLIAVVAAAIIYWDQWTGALVKWGSQFLEWIGVVSLIDGVLAAWDALPQWWAGFKNWLGTLDPFAFIGTSLEWITDKISGFADWLGIDLSNKPEAPKPIAPPPSLDVNKSLSSQGGVMQRITNANNSQTRSIGDVVVNNYGPSVNGNTLRDELAFMGG
ncbi:phage tail tape measure protein [Methylophaga thalassica]|uniref:Phage tail tape measure protein n=1 Tax=Methylophaga thalassica TaxID=40223 RepID=A0ABQ5TT18_9GAMM|nr:phage tail tape measure protein [Methylophaga thalassica]GLP98692.1 phage tail tape measure protein [Methylophaga thalassica]